MIQLFVSCPISFPLFAPQKKKKKSVQKGLCESEKALGNGSNLQPLHHQQIRWFDLLQGKMFTSLQFDYKGILGCDA
jgi:hypothetical protein